jgi:hypothetical protein
MSRLVLLCATLLLAGCFNPDKPSCSYACADSDPRCPDSYECRSDGYCHLMGTTDTCNFSDASVPLDMVTGNDLTSSPDIANAIDALQPDDLTPASD